MATVPQYTRQVSPQITPMPYQDLKVNGDMFGENIYKAQGNMGKALGDFTDAMLEIKNRVDDTKIVELTNKSSEWEQINLYDKENGYYYKTGKDAYGMSDSLLKDYDKYMNDYISKAGLSPAAVQRANSTVTGLRSRIMESVTAHDFKQGIAWSNSEAETGKNNYINNAVNMRNNPDEISKALVSGYQIIEWQGEIQHKDAAAINADKVKFRSDLHQAVLSSLISEGSLKASEYFEQHKGEISPEKLPQYVNAVKGNELAYTARNAAMGLLNLSLEDAYTAINSIADPQTRNATMQEYTTLTNQLDAIQRDKNNQFMSEFSSQLADALANGNDPNELKKSIMASDLPFDVKKKQLDFINDCVELGQEVNLWCDKESLDEMMHTDFEAFQKADLSKYALTKSEREQYRKKQQEVVEYSTEAQLRDIVKEFDTFFWAGKNSLDSGVYKDELVGLIARIERLQGKAFNIKDIDEGQLAAIIKGFDYKADAMPDELKSFGIQNFKNLDETKEIYMRAKAVAEVQEKVARSYVNFRAVNKREPEPQEMYGMVQKVYMDAAREAHARKQGVIDRKLQMQRDINSASIKKVGYTKVLTNFEEKTIPNLEKETGIKMNITSTYRPTGKYGHEKGLKADVFPANPTRQNIIKSAEYLLASPDVAVVFTSNPYVLSRFKGHKKLHDATKYDASAEAKKGNINHITHFDITLTKDLGGTEQSKEMIMTAAPSSVIATRK